MFGTVGPAQVQVHTRVPLLAPQLPSELTAITETASWTHQYQIAVTQSDHGTISPDTTYVAQGDSQSFSVTPDGGYYISSITTDAGSINVDTPSGQKVNFPDVQADHTITATFAISMASPSLTSTAPSSAVVGTAFHDSATLTAATSDAGGTVIYTPFIRELPRPALSVGIPDTQTVSSGSVPDSKSFTVSEADSYYFVAVYSGDSNNNGITGAAEPFTVTAALNYYQ